jgi:hypothetical protein
MRGNRVNASTARHVWRTAAGLAATTCLWSTAIAASVGSPDLEHQVLPGEIFTLPGVPDIRFDFNVLGADERYMFIRGSNGARIGTMQWTPWGDLVPSGYQPTNGNPGFVGAGVTIGTGAYVPSYGGIDYAGGWTYTGIVDHGYLGFSFQRTDGTHYGWVELTVEPGYEVFVHGYAYEEVAGQTILTGSTMSPVPEPGTFALSSLGAAVIMLARRRRPQRAA